MGDLQEPGTMLYTRVSEAQSVLIPIIAFHIQAKMPISEVYSDLTIMCQLLFCMHARRHCWLLKICSVGVSVINQAPCSKSYCFPTTTMLF